MMNTLNNGFGRIIQMIKQQSEQNTKLPIKPSQDKLTVLAITWNLFGSLPPINSLVELSKSQAFQPNPDVIYFGTQECQRSLCLAFCCQSKSEWEDMLVEVFEGYVMGVTETMGGLHSAVLVRKGLKDVFEVEQKDKLKAGLCNLVGNKGAISIEISILGQSFQLINCHLAAQQQETQQRNTTITRILDTLLRKDLHTEVIFLGDLNYRIQMGKKEYQRMIANRPNTEDEHHYREMVKKEQLGNQEELKGDFLQRFEEGEISFSPTYKIGVNSNEYNRERIPGWTDRIFHRKSKKMHRLSYGCESHIFGSDHRPVLALYQRPLQDHDFSIQSQQFIAVKSRNCQLI